ncbi:MAG: FAD/NAD(P)-binding protein [Alphaproteobacteria bacterium]
MEAAPDRHDGTDPMMPRPYRITTRRRDLADTFTMTLEPVEGEPMRFRPGQFNMLYVFGVGEVPVSISGDRDDPRHLVHTVRAVGSVTSAMAALTPGAVIGVRGPFGTAWPVDEAHGSDVVVVAGGVGLAPLRPVIYETIARRQKFGRVVILYGARTPADILFERELRDWRGRFDMSVHVTVDRAGPGWSGHVGVVTRLIERAVFEPDSAMAFVCGPEIMMDFATRSLEARGVTQDRIHVSMERNMKCAIGFCGHCQYGGDFICRDGAVFPYSAIRDRFHVREL